MAGMGIAIFMIFVLIFFFAISYVPQQHNIFPVFSELVKPKLVKNNRRFQISLPKYLLAIFFPI